MRKIITIGIASARTPWLTAALLLLAVTSMAQFNNEWIDHSKTYYKIKVPETGVYRIGKAVLDAAGLGSQQAQHFQLWRHGAEVPLMTSVASGAMGSNDYIEFYGYRNDGAPDRGLYRVPTDHLTDRQSLFTDTAIYFLTVNTASANRRVTMLANGAAGSSLSPVNYVWQQQRHEYFYDDGITRKRFVHPGFAVNFGDFVYSSAYDRGEMMSSAEIFPNQNNADFTNKQARFQNLTPYTGADAPAAKVRFALAGSSPRVRTALLFLNNTQIYSRQMSGFDARIDSVTNVAASALSAAVSEFKIQNVVNRPEDLVDRIVAGFMEVDYARQPDAGGSTQFSFYQRAGDAQMLELANFNHGGAAPILYSVQDHSLMMGDLQPNGRVRYLLPASGGVRQWIVFSAQAATRKVVSTMQARNFVNYSLTGNQGSYVIITNPLLMGGAGNPVQAYRDYRSSAVGGGYNAMIAQVDELTDQFAFGIKNHPLAIKNFFRFARRRFTAVPQHCLLIGKGVVYDEMRTYEGHPRAATLQMVPTFGYPASDVMLVSDDLTSNITMSVGRISAITPEEVKRYLDKVKQFESAQANPSISQADKAWMKNVVHVVGANDPVVESILRPFMENYRQTISDTLFGGRVTTFNKFNSGSATIIENELLSSLFEKGISLLTYYGHSSATALDYNLDDPSRYNNPGKYPAFLLNGCNAGNFFTFDTTRFAALNTISERYVLADNRGAIGMVASTHFGIINGLNHYSTGFYRSLSTPAGYGQALGKNVRDAISYMNTLLGVNDFQARIHTEQQTLHGDPAIRINAFAKPDFSVESSNVLVSPNFISIAESNFNSKIYYYNIGKAVRDSMVVEVKRQYPSSAIYPNGFTETVYRKKVRTPMSVDSLELSLPVIGDRDKGINKLLISLDTEGKIDEMSEANNSLSVDVVIFEDELRPVYPYNFAIVNKQGLKLVASTSNPLGAPLSYRMEMDTTELFNSSLKVTRNVTSRGGLIEFDPGVTFTDSTVYYWRLGLVPAIGGNPLRWNNASFVYLSGTQTGFNQNHFYQHTKSSVQRINIDTASRQWRFNTKLNTVFINHSIFPITGTEDNDFSISVNNSVIAASFCVGHSLGFNVFDPLTFKPWRNYPGGLFGSGINTCAGPNDLQRQYNFEFDDRDTANRRKIVNFMDAIPNGAYVIVRKVLDSPYTKESFAEILRSDEQYFGTGNSVYHRLKAAGFTTIDSFYRPRTWVFIYKKNDANYQPVIRMSEGLYDRVQVNTNLPTPDTMGFITSPLFGPAKSWKEVQWRGRSLDNRIGDDVSVEVYGVNASGQQTLLQTLNASQQNFGISNVSALQYPFIQLRMRNADTLNGTPYQLRWWRLYYDPVPEGALAPGLALQAPDTLQLGQPLDFKIAFKNISQTPFDSLRLRAFVVDRNNTTRPITLGRKKPLVAGDTITVAFTLDTKDLPGYNTLYLAVNPDNDQPEQFFFNNFLYKGFFVKDDKLNPVLDVTFDGARILNRDIVSAKPHIQIKLKDENTFLALNDTAALTVKLQFPGESTPRMYRWGTDTLRFTPGNPASGDNTATVDFFPTLTKDTENGDYELSVSGKDRNGNRAGNYDYRVAFQVFNKPMVSNLLNYPNPFSTSTAFVFTLTGQQVPQEFKIQIMTVTGKIVKEITRQELGDIRIGTNVTDYKWDGTDMFGGKLANGVYLYRVVTSLNGNKMEKFRLNDGYDQGDQDVTDQFFNKAGYGKMVILR